MSLEIKNVIASGFYGNHIYFGLVSKDNIVLNIPNTSITLGQCKSYLLDCTKIKFDLIDPNKVRIVIASKKPLMKLKINNIIDLLHQVEKDLFHDHIQKLAYFKWLNAGKPEGKSNAFWQKACNEILTKATLVEKTPGFSNSNFRSLIYLIEGYRQWHVAPPMLSMYSLFIRVAFNHHKKGQNYLKTFNGVIATNKKDCLALASAVIMLDKLNKNEVDFPDDMEANFDLFGLPIIHSAGIHSLITSRANFYLPTIFNDYNLRKLGFKDKAIKDILAGKDDATEILKEKLK